MDNIIDIELTGRSTRREQKLWQYDYGQVLRIAGKEFPKVAEVQFSLRQSGGHTLDRIGTNDNGLLSVQIPNELLQNKGVTSDYTIYAFVYLSGDGSGNTKYMIQLPVESRPEPTDPSEDPSIDPSIFKDAVNAVNASADRAETAEKSAKESADKAKEYADSAGKSKEYVEKARDNAISAIGTEKESALRGIESKTVESLQKIQSQTEESQNSINQSISDATEKKTELDGAISNATDAKGNLDKAVQSAGNAKTELDTSVEKAGEAKTSLDTTVEQANTVDASLKEQIGSAEQIQANVEQIAKNKADISSLNEDIGELNTSVFNIEESPNIFDKTKINQDKALVTWGTPTMTNYTHDKAGWVTSYPIAVRGGSTIHVYKFENGGIKDQNISNLITFAKDGSFIAIEGQNKNEIKLSENTAYIIFDISNLSFIDSLMLTTEPYNGVYKEYGRIKEDKIAKIAEDVSKINSDKTHIIFSFDAFKIDNRFELMKSYGFPFTIAIAQTILTYPISKDDYYNYFIDGNVDFSVYAGKGDRPADYRSDKDKWSAWVKELVDGLKETSGLYYPVMYSCQNNASSDILNQAVKENGFRMCRNGVYYNADGTTTYGILTDRKYLIDGTKYFDYYPLSVVKQEGYPTVEQIKAEIDNAIEKKKSIMLFTHYVIDDTQTMSDTDCPLSKFTAVLDYVKEKVDAGLCDVKNARQFWSYYNQQDGLDRDYKRTNMRNLFDITNSLNGALVN